jgi:CheY-like chemotaxis protein
VFSRTDLEPDLGRPVLWAGAALVGVGVLASVLIGALSPGGPHWSTGVMLSIYMLGAAAISGFLGMVFAIPRARAVTADPQSGLNTSDSKSGMYTSNSNLEEISDWLTKVLVGAGLVQLAALPGGLRALGDYLGEGLAGPNAAAAAVSFTVYGAGIGFLVVYLWVRLRLRILLEAAEKHAAAQAQLQVATLLAEAHGQAVADAVKDGKPPPPPPTSADLTDAAARAVATVQQGTASTALWVDDHPDNNRAERQALEALRISVDLARSTDEALQLLRTTDYGVIISDLGRFEGGAEVPDAGAKLIEGIRATGKATPIIIYAGYRAVAEREVLLGLGATFVTNRASDLVNQVAEAVTRRS